MRKQQVKTILWKDAAYSFEEVLPSHVPNPRLTTGIILSENENSVFIATNTDYDLHTGHISPVDGFVIPRGTILEIKDVGAISL